MCQLFFRHQNEARLMVFGPGNNPNIIRCTQTYVCTVKFETSSTSSTKPPVNTDFILNTFFNIANFFDILSFTKYDRIPTPPEPRPPRAWVFLSPGVYIPPGSVYTHAPPYRQARSSVRTGTILRTDGHDPPYGGARSFRTDGHDLSVRNAWTHQGGIPP